MKKNILRSRRSARAVAAIVATALGATLVSIVLVAGASAQSPGDGQLWLLSVEGGSVRHTVTDNKAENEEDQFFSDSTATQRGKIDVYIQVAPDGTIGTVGTPTGRYTELSWHLEGRDGVADEEGNGGPFNCDPAVTGEDFTPIVTGDATATQMIVEVDLIDAFESNEAMDCGGGFDAFATESQYLRESLTYCGPMHLPYAAFHTEDCRKSEPANGMPSVSGDVSRLHTHNWILTLTRVNSASPTSSPTSPQSPGSTPMPSPSMSPGNGGEPTPTPTPTATPSSHDRVSLMVFRRHLRAFGAVVLVGWGAAECVDTVPVQIQRRVPIGRQGDSVWRTVKTIQTSAIGVWQTRLKDQAGSYRARAPEVVKELATCQQATSRVKRHRHRG